MTPDFHATSRKGNHRPGRPGRDPEECRSPVLALPRATPSPYVFPRLLRARRGDALYVHSALVGDEDRHPSQPAPGGRLFRLHSHDRNPGAPALRFSAEPGALCARARAHREGPQGTPEGMDAIMRHYGGPTDGASLISPSPFPDLRDRDPCRHPVTGRGPVIGRPSTVPFLLTIDFPASPLALALSAGLMLAWAAPGSAGP